MKRIILIGLLFVMLLTLLACGQNEDQLLEEDAEVSIAEPAEVESITEAPTVSMAEPEDGETPEQSGNESPAEQSKQAAEQSSAAVPSPQSSAAPEQPQSSTAPANPSQSSTASNDGAGTERERITAFLDNNFPDYPIVDLDIRVGPRYTKVFIELEGADQATVEKVADDFKNEFGGEFINNGTFLDEIEVNSGEATIFWVID